MCVAKAQARAVHPKIEGATRIGSDVDGGVRFGGGQMWRSQWSVTEVTKGADSAVYCGVVSSGSMVVMGGCWVGTEGNGPLSTWGPTYCMVDIIERPCKNSVFIH